MENLSFLDAESFEKSFDVRIEPKLKTKEKVFLDKLKKKINIHSNIAFFPLGELYGIYKIKDLKEIKSHLVRLGKKKIFFTLHTLKKETIYGEFFFLNSIYLREDGIAVIPPIELVYSLNRKNIFNRIDILTFIRFKEKYSFKLYPKIFKYYDRKNFEYTVKELKTILGLEDTYYERFFDFEKNILKPIINDINKSSNFNINYEKIKVGSGKTNKIESLKFSFIDTKKSEQLKNTNLIIQSIKNDIKDIVKISSIIENTLSDISAEKVIKIIESIKTNFKPPLDIYLEGTLKSSFKINNDIIKIIDISEHFSSCFKIEGRLYRELSIYKFSYNYHFLQELQNLRIKSVFNYDRFPWKISVIFDKKGLSRIKVYMYLAPSTDKI
ncbi:MAG: replication initiation protein [Psychrilyobacter sp.]|nr:replication initiation protein [Psychrilyobacter sp.]